MQDQEPEIRKIKLSYNKTVHDVRATVKTFQRYQSAIKIESRKHDFLQQISDAAARVSLKNLGHLAIELGRKENNIYKLEEFWDTLNSIYTKITEDKFCANDRDFIEIIKDARQRYTLKLEEIAKKLETAITRYQGLNDKHRAEVKDKFCNKICTIDTCNKSDMTNCQRSELFLGLNQFALPKKIAIENLKYNKVKG